jgi:(2R)-3-sulfolactate dehydrogenase (NADP+)
MLPAIELVVTALASTQMGFEASSLFVDEGDKPRIGQAFWPSIGGAGRQRSLQGPL